MPMIEQCASLEKNFKKIAKNRIILHNMKTPRLKLLFQIWFAAKECSPFESNWQFDIPNYDCLLLIGNLMEEINELKDITPLLWKI